MQINAMIAAINEMNMCKPRLKQAKRQLAKDKEIVKVLTANKFTFGTMFLNAQQKEILKNKSIDRIEIIKKDIENWSIIEKILVIYLIEQAIPDFQSM